jgi:hypothetical protein
MLKIEKAPGVFTPGAFLLRCVFGFGSCRAFGA